MLWTDFFSSLSPHPSYFFGPMMGLNKAYQWIVRNVFVDMACIFNTVGNKNSKNLVWMGMISNIYVVATIYYNLKVLLHSDALIYKTQNNFCKERCKALCWFTRLIIRWYEWSLKCYVIFSNQMVLISITILLHTR